MEKIKPILVLFTGIFLMTISLSHAQPKLPKESIPRQIPNDVKMHIENLYSSDPLSRWMATNELGKMEKRAIPAIPYLIGMLGDESAPEWKPAEEVIGPLPSKPGEIRIDASSFFAEMTKPGNGAADTLVMIGKPAVEPLINALSDEDTVVKRKAAGVLKRITGKDLGQNHLEWQKWWEQNKDKFIEGR